MKNVGSLSSRVLSWETLFVFCVTLITICLLLFDVPFIELVELKAWDLHFQQRGEVEPSGLVAFVAIDERSVNRDGRWPWPRRQMAKLLEAVDEYGARVIGLDMGFFEPDLKLRKQALLDLPAKIEKELSPGESSSLVSHLNLLALQEDDDVILSDTISRLSVPLVLGHFFYIKDDGFVPPAPPPDVLEKAVCPLVITRKTPQQGRLIEAVGLETNIDVVRKASPLSGSFNVNTDRDGGVRWMPLVFRYEQRIFPSLAFQMLGAAFPDMPMAVKVNEFGVEDIRIGPVSIPTNGRGELLVNFYGKGYTFPHVSATELLHREAPADCLKGRIVVIGNTTMGLHDLRPTPLDHMFPGVELHCAVMENIIGQDFLRRVALHFDLGAIVGLALIFLVIQAFMGGALLAVATSILLGGFIACTHYLFLQHGLWLNHVYPALNLTIAYLGTSVHRYVKEEREKQKIRQTFGLYVHESVVEEMLAHPERLRLGGEKKELSVLFSDIRGFTSLSERLPPEELVPQLNEFLTSMTRVVFDHHGTLDKYIGDAVMAFFGAPLTQDDHPLRACATALDMMSRLRRLQEGWRERGAPILEIGVGVNSGMMMVGNMGSDRRFDYTVLGDNVNLASRLEGLTKIYGVGIIVSESVWNAVKDEFVGRELDFVQVRGRKNPTAIHELLCRQSEADVFEKPLSLYSEALRLYRLRDWKEAAALFGKVEEQWPGDRPSIIYRKRCEELLRHDPGDSWSYVTTLDSK